MNVKKSKRLTLIDYLLFYVPLKNFSLIWRRHHCRWRAAKFRPMLGVQGLWAGRDLYRATPAVTRDLGFSGLIRRTAQISRLLRHTWGCGETILTRIVSSTKRLTTYKCSNWPLNVKGICICPIICNTSRRFEIDQRPLNASKHFLCRPCVTICRRVMNSLS
jgi:predicted RNA-binding Zn-ribbon protein involved in translation (DUF1610 family)